MKKFVIERFQKIIEPTELYGEDLGYFINLLEQFKDECSFDKSDTIKTFSKSIVFLQQTQDFERFDELFPAEYKEFIQTDDDFLSSISDMMTEESSNAEDHYLEDTLYEIKSVGEKFALTMTTSGKRLKKE
ncbi:MAG: hypothetical protein IPF81_08410 [Bacteroidetes bacterium]|nr:hypothetical protein [Bacteroidota bacterium]